jgi:hypothetical protein
MTRRRKDSDPANLITWLGQPYIPQDPYNRLNNGPLRPVPFWFMLRGRYRYGCLLWLALIGLVIVFAVLLIQLRGLDTPSTITILCFAGLALLAGVIISRYLPKPGAAERHHKKHQAHRHQ